MSERKAPLQSIVKNICAHVSKSTSTIMRDRSNSAHDVPS